LPYIEAVGTNRGMQMKAFTDKAEAIVWLLSKC
jgi:hypothetical protein